MNHPSPLPSSGRPIRPGRARRCILLFLVLGGLLGAVGGCDRPCTKLMERFEQCAATGADRALRDGAGVREKIRIRCRRANQTRVEDCLPVKGCDRFLRCAARAVRAPKHRF